jgi:hypothetical protein
VIIDDNSEPSIFGAHFRRLLAAVFICSRCGSTIQGENVKVDMFKCVAYLSGGELPVPTCEACQIPMEALEA